MERRVRRSPQRQEALGLLLETLRQRHELDAVALSSQEGFLIAGAGSLDLERMAAVAASDGPAVSWEGRTVHVERFEQWGSSLCLATSGGQVGRDVVGDLRRILAELPALAA